MLFAAYLQRENIHVDLHQSLVQGLFCFSVFPIRAFLGLHSNFNLSNKMILDLHA